jgi:hypothetical protein
MNTIDSLNFKDADLTTLKSRLDILKEEVHMIKVEMKRLKNEKPKKSGVPRSEKSKSKKSSNPSVPNLSQVQRTELLSIEWSASGIRDWLEFYFKDSPDILSEALLKKFLSKVNSTFDNPKCGVRTISGSLKPSLKKWANHIISDSLEEETRDHILVAISSMYAIVDARISSLKTDTTNTSPSTRSNKDHAHSSSSPLSISKVVTFSNGSMTIPMNEDEDSQSQFDPIDDSLSIPMELKEISSVDDLSSSMASLSITPINPIKPILSLQLPSSFINETVPSAEFKIELDDEPEEDEEDEEDEIVNEDDNEEDSDFMTNSFTEHFKGHEMDCLSYEGFTSTSKMNGRTNMLIILFNKVRVAACIKNKWTYTESADIPLGMIENSSEDV